MFCRLDLNGTLDEVPQNRKQKVAAGLLLDRLHKQGFAGPLPSRASKVLGPISRYRVPDILPHMKLVLRASRPGLTVGFLRILCSGLCTQYGIVVMGFLDAFVYAHHQHRPIIENPGNFGDCMKGRISFMTPSLLPTLHAYQATCLTQHMPAVPHQNFRLSVPSQRSFHNTYKTDFRGWAFFFRGRCSYR